jgi:hypothetical protein
MNRKQWIERLNAQALESLADVLDSGCPDAAVACLVVADANNLEFVASDADGGPQDYERQIFTTPDGEMLNLWMDGPDGENGSRIGDGGVGFDDQVEWYTEREQVAA